MQELEIKDLLQSLKKESDEVFKLLDFPLDGLFPKENLKYISEKYTYLKEKYITLEKELRVKERKNQLTRAEEAHLMPAIQKLVLCASAPKGSMNKQKLSSCLYDFSDYLSYYYHGINS